jgi:hypothetical protein
VVFKLHDDVEIRRECEVSIGSRHLARRKTLLCREESNNKRSVMNEAQK